MLTNLPENFINKIDSTYRKPIQLLAIYFNNNTIWLSDRELTFDDITTLPIIEDWGELITSGNSEDGTTETREQTITIWNGGKSPFTDYFYLESPINVFADLYQTFGGLDFDEKVLIESFVIQEPIEYNERSRLVSIDLVTVNMRYIGNVGITLKLSDYPFALSSDVGKSIDLIIGEPGEIKTLVAKTPIVATQKGTILKLATTIYTNEDLDELNFPSAGLIEIDSEVMNFSSRTSNSLTVNYRGWNGTTIEEHQDGSQIIEYITDHTFIIGQGPLTSVSRVNINGVEADVDSYELNLASNPATITFDSTPKSYQIANSSNDIDLDFDATASDNTALYAYYCYDEEKRSYGAILDSTNSLLSILQNDEVEDIGEIIRCFLHVEHWSTKYYSVDSVNVIVDGIGIIGQLTKPSDKEGFDFVAEVDIDHPHSHVSGGTHDHPYTNANWGASNPSHLHSLTAAGTTTTRETSSHTLPKTFYITYTTSTYFPATNLYCGFSSVLLEAYTSSKSLHVEFYAAGFPGSFDYCYDNCGNTWSIGAGQTISASFSVAKSFSYWRLYYPSRSNVVGAKIILRKVTLTQTGIGTLASSTQATSVYNISAGDVLYRTTDTLGVAIKASSDVNALSTSNRLVDVISQTSATKTYIDKFDITKYLNVIDWSFFQNRKVQLQYSGSSESPEIVVVYVNLSIEYRRRTLEKSNNITCFPVGSIENRPDMVIQHLLSSVGFPYEKMGSIDTTAVLWDDDDTWNDNEVWLDNGELLTVPEGAYFELAASRFDNLGYALNGVIKGSESVYDAIKNICKQSRAKIVWNEGQAKLSVLEKIGDSIYNKFVEPDKLQFNSISVNLGKTENIINYINFQFDYNYLDGVFDQNSIISDLASQEKHGIRENTENWDFDLVNDQSMIDDLANYYIWRYGETTTEYTFSTYLTNFDLEKQDAITLTSRNLWDKLSSYPMIIKEIVRKFGSGKNKSMNLLEIIGYNTRTQKLYVELTDTVTILDDISVTAGLDMDFVDNVNINDEISIEFEKPLTDTVTVSDDNIEFEIDYKPSLSDSITVTDNIETTIEIVLTDKVQIFDPLFQEELLIGFGVENFGENFGSPTINNNDLIDVVTITDVIEITLT